MKFLYLALVFLCFSVAARAQTADGIPLQVSGEIPCLSYRFTPGDSLIYRLVSYDSVYFKEKEPLMKERMERIEIVCDSVGSNGHFYLRQTLKDYIAKESLGEMKDIVRTETPWIGRVAYIVIDSMGNRFIDSLEAPARSALSPGGAFQPPLIVGLYDSCTTRSATRTWMADRIRELVPESGFPAPIRVQTSLYELLPSTDTLGFPCLRFQYTLTGQSSFVTMDIKPPMRIAAVLAGGGNMLLSEEYRIPVFLHTGAQIKMDINTADHKLVKGTQYTQSFYTLEEFYRNGNVITDYAPANGTGKKKAKPQKK